MRLHEETARHNRGKCVYQAGGPGAPVCGGAAAAHLLVPDGDREWTTYSCAEHLSIAREGSTDEHEPEADCIVTGAHWMFSTTERLGWCFDPNGGAEAAALAIAEPVGASA